MPGMVSGHADTQPRAPNDTPANRALNRRVELFIVDPPMFGGVRATQ